MIPPGANMKNPMTTRDLVVNGTTVPAFEIELPGAPLLLAKGRNGYVMCGYLDMATADRLGQAAAIVRGVASLEQLLEKPVTDASVKARALGVSPGMSGRDALLKFV